MKLLFLIALGIFIGSTLYAKAPRFNEIHFKYVKKPSYFAAVTKENPDLWLDEIGQGTNNPGLSKKICKLWGKENCFQALSVAFCESGLNPDRIGDGNFTFLANGSWHGQSYGVFQVRHLVGRPHPKDLLDEDFNLSYAHSLWISSGWYPWSAYNSPCYWSYFNRLSKRYL